MENKENERFSLKCKQTAQLNEELQCILHSVPRLWITIYVNGCQRIYYTVSIEHAIFLAKKECKEAGWTKCNITAIEINNC